MRNVGFGLRLLAHSIPGRIEGSDLPIGAHALNALPTGK